MHYALYVHDLWENTPIDQIWWLRYNHSHVTRGSNGMTPELNVCPTVGWSMQVSMVSRLLRSRRGGHTGVEAQYPTLGMEDNLYAATVFRRGFMEDSMTSILVCSEYDSMKFVRLTYAIKCFRVWLVVERARDQA